MKLFELFHSYEKHYRGAKTYTITPLLDSVTKIIKLTPPSKWIIILLLRSDLYLYFISK